MGLVTPKLSGEFQRLSGASLRLFWDLLPSDETRPNLNCRESARATGWIPGQPEKLSGQVKGGSHVSLQLCPVDRALVHHALVVIPLARSPVGGKQSNLPPDRCRVG